MFSGANSQPLRPWTVEFLAQAEIVGDAHDNLRELRLKLRDPARAYFNRRYPANDLEVPLVLEAMAYLSKEFGPKYEESQLFAAYYSDGRRGSFAPTLTSSPERALLFQKRLQY